MIVEKIQNKILEGEDFTLANESSIDHNILGRKNHLQWSIFAGGTTENFEHELCVLFEKFVGKHLKKLNIQ